MTAKIIVVGSLSVDMIIQSSHLPKPGETIVGGTYIQVTGGKGANQAVGASRLGADVSMVGRIGSDANGDIVRENLTIDGVNQDHVKSDSEGATAIAFILVDEAGENSIVVASGANMELTTADVDEAAGLFDSAEILLLQLESPIETITHAAQLAQQKGVTVILNPAPAQPLPEALLSAVDVLIPNETEAAMLSGMSVDTLEEAEAAGKKLLETVKGSVILTLGGRGSLVVTAESAELVPAFKVDVLDTTAAGDSFVGGFAVALAEGKSLAEAARFGNATGGLATTKMGAQTSLPTRTDADAIASSS